MPQCSSHKCENCESYARWAYIHLCAGGFYTTRHRRNSRGCWPTLSSDRQRPRVGQIQLNVGLMKGKTTQTITTASFFFLLSFYRATLCRARYCHGKLSVYDVEVSWSYRLEFLENNFTAVRSMFVTHIKLFLSELFLRSNTLNSTVRMSLLQDP